MKLFIFAFTVFAGLSASAANITVTSFSYINGKTPHAELCGVVHTATSKPSFVRLVVDPRGKPGVYNTVAGLDGKFCLTLISYTGEAEVSLFGDVPALASIKK